MLRRLLIWLGGESLDIAGVLLVVGGAVGIIELLSDHLILCVASVIVYVILSIGLCFAAERALHQCRDPMPDAPGFPVGPRRDPAGQASTTSDPGER